MTEKTFWAPLKNRKVDHLWRTNPFNAGYIDSGCGLVYGVGRYKFDSPVEETITGTPCKNCQKQKKPLWEMKSEGRWRSRRRASNCDLIRRIADE